MEGINSQYGEDRQSRVDCLLSIQRGEGLTINMERIDSQHLAVHINRQSFIADPFRKGRTELCSPTISVPSTGLYLVSFYNR